MELAPIIIFAYKRVDTLKQTIESLKKCVLASESNVHIFSDGAKSDKDFEKVETVRNYLRQVKGFKGIRLYFAETNKGLANSIIQGTTEIFTMADKLIVLEDDILVSANFILYMNECLEKYKKNQSVFSVAAYNYPFKNKIGEKNDVYFLPRCSSIGWATWKDRWANLDWSIKDYKSFSNDKERIKGFKRGGSDLMRMLRKQQKGKIDSWAIRWAYNQYLQGSLTVYPILSKIRNIGFSSDATNTNTYNNLISTLDDGSKREFILPESVKLDPFYHRQLLKFYSLSSTIRNKFRTAIYRLHLIENKQE